MWKSNDRMNIAVCTGLIVQLAASVALAGSAEDFLRKQLGEAKRLLAEKQAQIVLVESEIEKTQDTIVKLEFQFKATGDPALLVQIAEENERLALLRQRLQDLDDEAELIVRRIERIQDLLDTPDVKSPVRRDVGGQLG